MNTTHSADAQLIIRKPVEVVFNALIDPAVTTKFWFTKSSGPLEEGKTITWQWEMYNASGNVTVKEIVPNKLIATEWGDPATAVDYKFTALDDNMTFIEVKNYGFTQQGDDLINVIKDSTGGFSYMLSALKAYLEHGIQLNLVLDHFPHAQNVSPEVLNNWMENR